MLDFLVKNTVVIGKSLIKLGLASEPVVVENSAALALVPTVSEVVADAVVSNTFPTVTETVANAVVSNAFPTVTETVADAVVSNAFPTVTEAVADVVASDTFPTVTEAVANVVANSTVSNAIVGSASNAVSLISNTVFNSASNAVSMFTNAIASTANNTVSESIVEAAKNATSVLPEAIVDAANNTVSAIAEESYSWLPSTPVLAASAAIVASGALLFNAYRNRGEAITPVTVLNSAHEDGMDINQEEVIKPVIVLNPEHEDRMERNNHYSEDYKTFVRTGIKGKALEVFNGFSDIVMHNVPKFLLLADPDMNTAPKKKMQMTVTEFNKLNEERQAEYLENLSAYVTQKWESENTKTVAPKL